jgi:putative copper resistance protein D
VTVEVALVVCRYLRDASALGLWGAFAYLAVLVPRELAGDIDKKLACFRVCSGLLVVTMTAAFLPLQTGIIGNGWSDVVNLQTMYDVAFETSVGLVWQVQAVAAAAVCATLLVRRRHARMYATAAASALFLVTLAWGGHAAMRSGPLGLLDRLNNAVHLLSAGAWLGALIPLVAILASVRSPGKGRAMCVSALWRFSRAGRIAVGAVFLTGIGNTVFIVGRWPMEWRSTYQMLLALKIVLAVAMAALAVVNRYVIVPKLPIHAERALKTIRRNSIVEIGIGLTVVWLVAAFGTLDPRQP